MIVDTSGGRFARRAALALAFIAALDLLPAHPTAQDRSGQVFRGGVDYVAVDAVVTGSGNRPVRDLTAADFAITENGKPQKIVDFRFVDVPLASRHLSVAPPVPGAPPPPPPPDVVSNAPASPNSRLFVLIIDDLHLIESMIVPVQRVMTDFFNRLSPDDDVAVVFVSHANLSQNFTRDPAQLLKTVGSVRAAFGMAIGVYQDEQVEEFPYARSVVWQLQNVAKTLAGSTHARRAIVFVGAFSQLDPSAAIGSTELMHAQMLQLELNDAYEIARRADVPIYTLDPRGIPNDGNALSPKNPNVYKNPNANPYVLIQRASAPPDMTIKTPPVVVDQPHARVQQDRLSELAINTGGRAFINRSDLSGAIDEIVTENGSFYQLGYYADPSVHDGKFHSISVSVSRPGTHVRAKPGYVAGNAAAPEKPRSLEAELGAAMGSGFNVSGLGLRAFVAPIATTAKGMRSTVTIEVTYPPGSIPAGRLEDDLDIGIVAVNSDGKIKAKTTRPWHFAGTPPVDGSVTLLVDDIIELPGEALTLRIAASSKAVGRSGMVQIPIDVPRVSSDALSVSPIVIGLPTGGREPALGADALRALVPFQPTPRRTFAPTDTMRLFARAFWRGKGGVVHASLAVDGAAGAAPREVPVTPAGTTTGGAHEVSLDTTLPLAGFARGDYVLRLDVTLDGGPATTRRVPFTIR